MATLDTPAKKKSYIRGHHIKSRNDKPNWEEAVEQNLTYRRIEKINVQLALGKSTEKLLQ